MDACGFTFGLNMHFLFLIKDHQGANQSSRNDYILPWSEITSWNIVNPQVMQDLDLQNPSKLPSPEAINVFHQAWQLPGTSAPNRAAARSLLNTATWRSLGPNFIAMISSCGFGWMILMTLVGAWMSCSQRPCGWPQPTPAPKYCFEWRKNANWILSKVARGCPHCET